MRVASPPVAYSIPASTRTITTLAPCTVLGLARRHRAGPELPIRMRHRAASRATASSQPVPTNQQRIPTRQRITLLLPRIIISMWFPTSGARSTPQHSQARPLRMPSPSKKTNFRFLRGLQCPLEALCRRLGSSCSTERTLRTRS